MGMFDDFYDSISNAYDSAAGAVTDVYDSTVDGVSSLFEDSETPSQTYEQTVAYEATASGAVSTTVPYAQTNTGATVTPSTASDYTPYLIGGGIFVVVLVVVALMVGRK
jgi:hypothetical protein